ncbi:MAG: S8 family peptidase [Anaerolineae bacterium]|nr:S8 family peptidase [Anaerolineae bacterium]
MPEKKSHISLTRLDERPRHKPRVVIKPPLRNNVEHSSTIKRDLAAVKRDIQLQRETYPAQIEPILLVRVDAQQKLSEEELRRSNLTLLDEDTDKSYIVLSSDNLNELENRVDQYGQAISEGENPRYGWLASINKVSPINDEIRIGPKLQQTSISDDDEYRLDVEIILEPEKFSERLGKLRDFIDFIGGKVLDTYMGRNLAMARIQILGKYLEDLLHQAIISKIELPPEPDFGVSEAIETGLDSFGYHTLPSPPDDAPRICIIDSGIMPGHPMLSSAVGETRSFSSTTDSGVDEHGHGTQVTGIALYGDVKSCIDSLTFEPSFFVFGARVLNSTNQFDENRLIVNQMEEAIRYYHDEFGCRIFNISIADPDQVYSRGKPSPWSQILDQLAFELDVIIVVAAGNLTISGLRNELADNIRSSYPTYILDGYDEQYPTGILEPAVAANVITVGALAHTDQSLEASRHPNDVDIQSLACIDGPSPFTRCGPGVGGAIKPDVCEYGGNLLWRGWRGHHSQITPDRHLGIISTNHAFTERLFTTESGTSFAAPKVTHLAARILERYPSASANLIRALIVNAARIPDAIRLLFSDEKDVSKIVGYGKPELDRAIFSTDNSVTLLSDDSMPLDTIHLYEIPIPEEFQTSNGTRRIIITLAYDSPVRNRSDYLGAKMQFRLYRGLKPEDILAYHAERDDDEDPDPVTSNKCRLVPSSTAREGGTIQRAIFEVKQNRVFTDHSQYGGNLHLLVRSKAVWVSHEEFPIQKYALAITIEHENAMLDVYTKVTQQIQTRQRVRVRQ